MRVATHDGSFHADDVFAVAVLRRLHPDLEIVRSRDPEVLAAADLRVDVGRASDPATCDFDHHQKGGAGVRENGIPYASFGLVWRELGTRLTQGDERAAREVEERLVQGVDAIDTGFNLSTPKIDGVRPMDVSDVIDAFNPGWDDDATPADRLARFEHAVALAEGIIDRQIAGALGRKRAHGLVREAIANRCDPRVVELDRNMPWHEPVVTEAPEALFVLVPKSDGSWGVQAIPQRLGTFDNRRDLPEAWAGLNAAELSALTGVEDAVFCHSARFIAVAKTREGAARLVELALQDEG